MAVRASESSRAAQPSTFQKERWRRTRVRPRNLGGLGVRAAVSNIRGERRGGSRLARDRPLGPL